MVSKSTCEDKTHFGTVPNNLESIQLTQSANLSSMSDQGVFELVWENGQLLTRGFPKRCQKIPSCNIGHSFHSSNARLENGRPKFVTSDSIVYDSHHNTSSMPKDKQNEPVLLHELYKSHFNYDCFLEHTRGNNISYDHRLLKDSQSQVVPVHETAPTTGNSQAHQFSLQQQHHQVSKTLEPERKKERVNLSLFLRSTAVAVPTRGEKLQNKPEPVLLASATYGLKSVKDSMDINANMSVPDVQSEAVNGQSSSSPTGKCKEPAVPSSSLCSLGASNNPTYNTFKRRYEDTEGSACSSDHNEEKLERKAVPARGSKSNKKKRTPEVHNLSERRRRDKINKKMRALQELIPNCNKVDKASMPDEAIAYLKTLQFQVKMMSMGSGVCMPPMMLRLPTGMQQMHTPQMSHFSPMGIGMGVGCNPAQFLIPPTAVPGIFPQPLPMSMLSAQLGLGVSRAVAAPFTKSNNSSKI